MLTSLPPPEARTRGVPLARALSCGSPRPVWRRQPLNEEPTGYSAQRKHPSPYRASRGPAPGHGGLQAERRRVPPS